MAHNIIEDYIKVEERSTPSDRIFNSISMVCTLVVSAILIAFFIVNIFSFSIAIRFWSYMFYPMLIIEMLALTSGIGQLIRNTYLSAIISIVISTLNIFVIIGFIIIQGILDKKLYIPPFFTL